MSAVHAITWTRRVLSVRDFVVRLDHGAVGAPPVRGKGWSPPMQSYDSTTQPLFGPTWRTRVESKGGPMSSTSPVRLLPAAPGLEYARTEAKAPLRQTRAGDTDALRRRHRPHPESLPRRQPTARRPAARRP